MINKLIRIKFVRFLIVGFINTIFGYGLFSFFIWIGLHYSLSAFFSTILGVLFNFKTISTLVYDSHDNSLIVRFFGVYGIIYILNITGLYLLNLYGLNAYISGAVLILPLTVISFLLNKKLVFKTNN